VEKSLLRTDREIEEIYTRHVDTVYLVCSAYMKNPADTEDMTQNTFINLMKYNGEFQNVEHEKAWLLRTAINLCKNNLSHWWRKRADIAVADYENLPDGKKFEIDETLQAVMDLPTRYKAVIILYYYEGYRTDEIARILKKPGSTVRNHLREARNLLKGVLENEK
jgi:RNA polymerase sigma-70 factor (ECF subfamily)